jgi:hypothetical protein
MEKKNAITELSGSIGIGALHVLGLFFILDGRFAFLGFVEPYAYAASWNIFVTLLVLLVSHVLGVLSMLVSDAVLSHLFNNRYSLAPLFVQVTLTKSEQLMARYLETERLQRFLAGVALSFLTLSLGSWSEVRMMGSYGAVGYVGMALSVLACCGCVALAMRMRSSFAYVVEAFCSHDAQRLPVTETAASGSNPST